MLRTGRPEKFRHRKVFSTSFEGELLDEFTKQCQEKRKDRNEVLAELMETYLKMNAQTHEEKLSLFSQQVVIMPDVQATNEEWNTYWKGVTDFKEATRLEGLFSKRYSEAKQRYFQLKVKGNNKTIEAKVYK